MPLIEIIAVIIVGYLLGAIPFAVIVAKRCGVNIFKVGSGNPGATNVTRVLGKGPGNLVFFLDFFKGLVAATWVQIDFVGANPENQALLSVLGLGAAVLGHSFSVFIKFKGGKGVATTIGGLIGITPVVMIAGILVWVFTYYSRKIVSLASIALAISLPIWAIFFDAINVAHIHAAEFIFVSLISVLVLVRHKSNIIKIVQGTESSFDKNKVNRKK
jgi:glycerol-3-phosphate acyltransferase PlsY